MKIYPKDGDSSSRSDTAPPSSMHTGLWARFRSIFSRSSKVICTTEETHVSRSFSSSSPTTLSTIPCQEEEKETLDTMHVVSKKLSSVAEHGRNIPETALQHPKTEIGTLQTKYHDLRTQLQSSHLSNKKIHQIKISLSVLNKNIALQTLISVREELQNFPKPEEETFWFEKTYQSLSTESPPEICRGNYPPKLKSACNGLQEHLEMYRSKYYQIEAAYLLKEMSAHRGELQEDYEEVCTRLQKEHKQPRSAFHAIHMELLESQKAHISAQLQRLKTTSDLLQLQHPCTKEELLQIESDFSRALFQLEKEMKMLDPQEKNKLLLNVPPNSRRLLVQLCCHSQHTQCTETECIDLLNYLHESPLTKDHKSLFDFF